MIVKDIINLENKIQQNIYCGKEKSYILILPNEKEIKSKNNL